MFYLSMQYNAKTAHLFLYILSLEVCEGCLEDNAFGDKDAYCTISIMLNLLS